MEEGQELAPHILVQNKLQIRTASFQRVNPRLILSFLVLGRLQKQSLIHHLDAFHCCKRTVYPLTNNKCFSLNSTRSPEFGKHRGMLRFCETDTNAACCLSLSTAHDQLNEAT
jgi:hypothetical protein